MPALRLMAIEHWDPLGVYDDPMQRRRLRPVPRPGGAHAPPRQGPRPRSRATSATFGRRRFRARRARRPTSCSPTGWSPGTRSRRPRLNSRPRRVPRPHAFLTATERSNAYVSVAVGRDRGSCCNRSARGRLGGAAHAADEIAEGDVRARVRPRRGRRADEARRRGRVARADEPPRASSTSAPLEPSQRDRYRSRWQDVQSGFVDHPASAVGAADDLIQEVMRERGYPVDDFERGQPTCRSTIRTSSSTTARRTASPSHTSAATQGRRSCARRCSTTARSSTTCSDPATRRR